MRNIIKGIRLILAAVLLLAFAGQSFAFCVHNKSDRGMQVNQVSGGKWYSFSAWLDPGQDGCCHWSNTGCNKKGGQRDPVSFTVERDIWSDTKSICVNVEIPACGWIEIKGSGGNYRCETHSTCN